LGVASKRPKASAIAHWRTLPWEKLVAECLGVASKRPKASAIAHRRTLSWDKPIAERRRILLTSYSGHFCTSPSGIDGQGEHSSGKAENGKNGGFAEHHDWYSQAF